MAQPIPEWVQPDTRKILERLNDLEDAMALTQEQLDAYATQAAQATTTLRAGQARLETVATGLAADLQALKDGASLDGTNLEANLSALQDAVSGVGGAVGSLEALDAQNPPAPAP